MAELQVPDSGLTLVYDGDCPVCRTYVTRLRLRRAAGRLDLLDARQQQVLVQQMARRGYRLDDGMLLIVDDQYYHGAAAMHVLALMSGGSDWFNRLNYRLFRSPRLSSVLYPLLVSGRRALLWLLGRKPLSSG